jgi:hypothetical protein
MPRKKKYTLKLSVKGRNLIIETLDTTRVSHHGYGTYLIKYRPKEILVTKKAKEALMKCSRVLGLAGMEFYKGRSLAWGVPTPNASVPLKYVSVPDCVKSTIEGFDVIDE